MKAVGYLHSFGRTLQDAIGVSSRAIPGHHLDPRMCAEPFGQGIGLAVRQQVHHAAALQVDQNRAVALVLFPCPIIDTEHTRRVGVFL
jgi:hypothetical protein